MPDTATPRRTRTPLKVIGQAAPLLEVASLRKRYGDQFALADVSFSVRAGEILGLIGPNGAGKTTLMEAIAGVIPADTGGVSWQGTSLESCVRANAQAAYAIHGCGRPLVDVQAMRRC